MWAASMLTMVIIMQQSVKTLNEDAFLTDIDMLQRLGLPYMFAGECLLLLILIFIELSLSLSLSI